MVQTPLSSSHDFKGGLFWSQREQPGWGQGGNPHRPPMRKPRPGCVCVCVSGAGGRHPLRTYKLNADTTHAPPRTPRGGHLGFSPGGSEEGGGGGTEGSPRSFQGGSGTGRPHGAARGRRREAGARARARADAGKRLASCARACAGASRRELARAGEGRGRGAAGGVRPSTHGGAFGVDVPWVWGSERGRWGVGDSTGQSGCW